MEEKLLYNIRETTEQTGLSRSYLFEEIARGRLKTVKVGRRRLVPHSALVAYVESLEAEQTPAG